MPQGKVIASDIKGLTPAIDPVQSQEIFALNGRNYIFDSKGPKSAFGNRLLNPCERAAPAHMQGFRFRSESSDRVFHCDNHGIWEWSESLGSYRLIYQLPDTTNSPSRWTHAYLNGYLYMAHPRVGLLAYHIELDICVPHEEIGVGTPNQVIAVAENNGRLIALTPILFAWSAPSDGLDFSISFGGAGFQLISERVSGSPIMVTSYSRGCLTWTTGGVMRSEFTGDVQVYRHRSLNTEYRPVNSFCTARVDEDTTIILDERGLFKSQGENLTPFAPLFNEFLLGYIQSNNLKVGQNIRLEWDELQKLMFISCSLSYDSALYETCFVLYPPVDKWGQFNESHYGILPILVEDSLRADDYYGYVDSAGKVRYWLSTGSRETTQTNLMANLWQPIVQKSIGRSEGVSGYLMSTTGRIRTQLLLGQPNLTGYYLQDAEAVVPPSVAGLDAEIQIGLFRPLGDNSSDQLSEVCYVLVRNNLSGSADKLTADYNLIPASTDDEDYNLAVGTDDYGFGDTNYINHSLTVIGTMDGVTVFDSQDPTLETFTQASRYYSCSIVGAWHLVKIGAIEIGESFHVKSLELTVTPAGRML